VADLGLAIAQIDRVLAAGAVIHRGTWHRQPAREHVDHALVHLNAWQAGAADEDHLGHASTRLLMAMQLAAGEVVP
jgi:hypothetical protein